MPHRQLNNAIDFYLNLTTPDDEYPYFHSGQFTHLTVAVKADTTTYTWGTAVATLQFSPMIGVNDDGEDVDDWQAFPTSTTLTTSSMSARGVSIAGAGWLRLHVTTAAGAADPHAPTTIVMT